MDLAPPIEPRRTSHSWLAGLQVQSQAWLISMAVHLAGLTLLAIVGVTASKGGGQAALMTQLSFSVGQDTTPTGYDEDVGSGGAAAFEAAASQRGTISLREALDEPAPVDPTAVLPTPVVAMANPSGADLGGPYSAQGADRAGAGIGFGLSGRGSPGGIAGKGRTRVFGIEGEGYKFVYVFDRSGSMGGVGRNALSAAKAELLSSLESLEPTHQFQIIFYNETPLVFNPSGQPGKLAFANQQNKQRARQFIAAVTADGGTRHEDALKAAIKLQPDVIFFLTDADEPRMSTEQLARLHRSANGIVIHAIEFGLGPKRSAEENFLAKLARQNGGQYVYVDIMRLFPAGVADGQ